MSDYLAEQLGNLRAEIADLRRGRSTHKTATVADADVTAKTFTAEFPTGERAAGVAAPAQFMPAVGDAVWLRLDGATPIYEPARIAADAVGYTEIDGVVTGDISGARTTADTALSTANGKNTVNYSINAPSGAGFRQGDLWFRRDAAGVVIGTWEWDGAAWVSRIFGDQVLNSLTVGKITSGTVAAGVSVKIGDPANAYQELTSSGAKIFRKSPEGVVEESGRLGFGPGDYLGGGQTAAGQLAWMIPDTGVPTFQGANFTEEITVRGRTLNDLVRYESANHQYGYAAAATANLTGEVGLIEVEFSVNKDHMYWLVPEVGWSRNDSTAELRLRVRDAGAATPTVTSELRYFRQFSNVLNNTYGVIATSPGLYENSTGGQRRFLLTAEAGGAGSVSINDNPWATLSLIDLGPKKPIVASVNRGGGSTPPPTQQYDTGELSPAGWETYTGGNVKRTDTTDVVQGYNAANGDGKGYWWWNLPSITGTVDRVDVYIYFHHWYFNSGGTAIINLTSSTGGLSDKLRTDWHVGGWPKPGGRWVTVPTDWFAQFKNTPASGPRARGISLGPSGGTNLTFYGRAIGSASRLRLWYTQ